MLKTFGPDFLTPPTKLDLQIQKKQQLRFVRFKCKLYFCTFLMLQKKHVESIYICFLTQSSEKSKSCYF